MPFFWVCLLCLESFGGGDVAGVALGAKVFVPVWLLIALTNMWVGVTKAGYSVAQELPILFVVAAVPTAIATLMAWQLTKG